jgi:hypothetical protein
MEKWVAVFPEGSNGFWHVERDGFPDVGVYTEDAEQVARRFAASANQLAFLTLELLENPEYSVEKELKNLDSQIQEKLQMAEKLGIALAALDEFANNGLHDEQVQSIAREALRKIADA